MFHPFVSAAAPHPRPTRAAILSIALHASLFVLAIAPLQPARYTAVPEAAGEKVEFAEISLAYRGHASNPRASVATTRKSAPPQKSAAPHNVKPKEAVPPSLPTVMPVAFDIPEEVTVPDAPNEKLVDTLWLTSSNGKLSNGASAVGTPSPALALNDSTDSSTEVYIASKVEKSAEPMPENPKPEYPRDMLRRNIETSFIVFFVVDTAGRVDKATIQVPPSVQEQFSSAVTRVMVKWHFLPAQRNGRHVRQLVEQPFSFRIVEDDRMNRRAGLRNVRSQE
jgi:TonB family protein